MVTMEQFHPDFDLPWVKKLLEDPTTTDLFESKRIPLGDPPEGLGTNMFYKTLYTDHGLRAQLNFRQKTKEPDAIGAKEWCCLFSMGDGLDGAKGRGHGGFSSLIIDHMTGWCAAQESNSLAPSTATMTVDYKAPVDTPGVIFCKSWLIERNGRTFWAKARIEDGQGKVLAQGKALFLTAKQSKI